MNVANLTRDLPATVPPSLYDDPLDADAASDAAVHTTRRGLIRLALVAAETGARFQREGIVHDAMAWMITPRALFGGAAAVDACMGRDACLRGIVLHGLSLGLDAEPDAVDELITDANAEAVGDRAVAMAGPARRPGGVPRQNNVLPFKPRPGNAPRLFTATVVHDDGVETVHAFHASFAVDETEIAGRLYARMGAAAADAAIVTGFDHTSPIVEALVSKAICDTLMMIDAAPHSPLAAGLDLNIEQRFLA
ncbi:MAG: hypothetical protein V4459_04025 [Pseudomonadota bacterium]